MDTATAPARAVGILGGMGPLSSAEFVRTIYEQGTEGREQEDPVVHLWSDPTIPDRTEAFLAGRDDLVLPPIASALERLVEMGAGRLVVCCMTSHHLLPRLPAALRARVVSLVDVTVEALEHAPGRHLMVCSSGTRQMRIFERHPRWPRVAARVVVPDDAEQEALHHEMIYRAKRGVDPLQLTPVLTRVLGRHGLRSFVAGCSEVHLLAKRFLASPQGTGYACVDPFALLAHRIAEEARSAHRAHRPAPALASA